tara:strand:+ start:661 stop:1332 length:672 start_codon:yes stop_codon:yes gene_type:complete
MIKTLASGATIEDMHNLLKSDGVFLVNNYITGDLLKGLHDEVLDLCENQGGHYEFGRNYRGPSLSNFPSSSYLTKVFNSEWMKSLHQVYRGTNQGYCSSMYATYDYKNNEGLARNGWLHFDRGNALKFFIYLNDVDKTNGAFSVSPGSRSKGQELRESAWDGQNYKEVLNRIDLDYPELKDDYPFEYVEAKAGTLIIFDTDTFHKGGECEEGKSRLVVRGHCK